MWIWLSDELEYVRTFAAQIIDSVVSMDGIVDVERRGTSKNPKVMMMTTFFKQLLGHNDGIKGWLSCGLNFSCD